MDLPAALVRQARRAPNTTIGDLGFILDHLPIQEAGADGPCCQFLFMDGSTLAFFSIEMPTGFFYEYQSKGCSVRGGKAGVMAVVEEQSQEQAYCWGLVM